MPTIRPIICGATLFALASLASYSVLLARADVSFLNNNLNSLRAAVQLAPTNAAYHELLAEHLEAAGVNPDDELEIAIRLSPHESRYWIRRSFRAEMEQNYQEAERDLIEANAVDLGFDPRWALMNFYFRRGNLTEFRRSAHAALGMSYGNRDPIFRLCLAIDGDPLATETLLPKRREIQADFLRYLLKNHSVALARTIAGEVAAGAGLDEAATLVEYSDKQKDRDRESSLAVWNILCRRGILPFAELLPQKGNIITNSSFMAIPLYRRNNERYLAGYDWIYSGDGISINPMDAETGISIDVSGKQPDVSELLAESVPLMPERAYVVNYEYRLVATQPNTGLRWILRGADSNETSGDRRIGESPALSDSDWANGRMVFNAGRNRAATLALEYRRMPGSQPWAGTVQIRRVTSALAAN
jgi:hypothetical protein